MSDTTELIKKYIKSQDIPYNKKISEENAPLINLKEYKFDKFGPIFGQIEETICKKYREAYPAKRHGIDESLIHIGYSAIDFSRTAQASLQYTEEEPLGINVPEFSEPIDPLITEETLETIRQTFHELRYILGLQKNKGRYTLTLREDPKREGGHDFNSYTQGHIWLNSLNLRTREFNFQNTTTEIQPPFGLLMKALAHEMYHSRQALIFPKFYEKSGKRYIDGTIDYQGYLNQTIELGARLFAQKYLEFLIERYEKIPKEESVADKKKREFRLVELKLTAGKQLELIEGLELDEVAIKAILNPN